MLKSKSLAALALAALLAASSQSYAQTQPDPHHPATGGDTAQTTSAPQDQQGMSMPMMMNMMAGMMKMMAGSAGQMGRCGTGMPAMGMTEHVEGRIAFLRAELQITDAQAKAWDAFATVLRDNAKRMQGANMQMMPDAKTPRFQTMFDTQERMLTMKLEQVKATKAAFVYLYEVLSADQRKTVDELLQTHIGLMPPGMMQDGMMQNAAPSAQ